MWFVLLWSYLLNSVISKKCNILLLDAGQISIRSSLVDKKSKRLGDLKRHQEFSAEDLTSLASYIYDKYTVKLEAAQVRVIHSFVSDQIKKIICSLYAGMIYIDVSRRWKSIRQKTVFICLNVSI